jgi:hypothetical protein
MMPTSTTLEKSLVYKKRTALKEKVVDLRKRLTVAEEQSVETNLNVRQMGQVLITLTLAREQAKAELDGGRPAVLPATHTSQPARDQTDRDVRYYKRLSRNTLKTTTAELLAAEEQLSIHVALYEREVRTHQLALEQVVTVTRDLQATKEALLQLPWFFLEPDVKYYDQFKALERDAGPNECIDDDYYTTDGSSDFESEAEEESDTE